MKQNDYMKKCLVAALVAATAWCYTPMLHAQDDTAKAGDRVAATNSAPDEPVVEDDGSHSTAARQDRTVRLDHHPAISFWSDAVLKEGESTEAVVAIGGSARAHGKVREAVVAIGGDAEADEDVGAAVVAIAGNATARGKVGAAVVAIVGDAEAHGEVRESVVAVMGDVRIGSNAVVRREVVSVGGKVTVEPGAQIKGKVTEVGVGPLLIPLKGLADWFKHCALKLRLLAPQPGWYWVIPGVFLLGYLLITIAFPRPVTACVNELTQRPATTFLLGLLMELLVPLVVLVLAATGIGALAVPFIYAAIFIGGLVGKAALFQFLGRQMVRVFGVQLSQPVLAMLTGFGFITMLYMVPLLGLLAYTLTGMWGIGTAVTASFGRMRKESPDRPASQPPIAGPGATATAPAASAAAFPATMPFTPEPDAPPVGHTPETGVRPGPMAVPPVISGVSEALTLPRANFWERMGAAFLDVILVSILGSIVGGPPLGFLVALAYFAGMWAWKGTTIGGIVLNLKVVRLDDKPVTFAVSLVRGLASAFSVIVFFLGFLWMIWDRDKQTWHDKIAGTVVIRQPRGMSLVCL